MKRLQHITRQSQAIGNKKIEDRNFKFVTNYANQTTKQPQIKESKQSEMMKKVKNQGRGTS